MITFFRRWLTSWPALILLGLVLLAFAVTGIGDPFGKSAPAGAVAKIGDRTISEPDLLAAFDRAVRNVRQRNPAASQVQLAREGGVAVIAESLIGQAAIEQLGARNGIKASDRAVGAAIAGIDAFKQGGKFDEATYRRLIAEQRLSDRDLRNSIAGDIVRRQMITPVTAALPVPDGMARAYAQLLVDVHRGGVALVPLAAITPATEADINAYYAANKARFTVPERRAFRFAMIDRAAIAAGLKVSDAEIAKAFAADPAKYGAAPTRRLQQVVVGDETKAKAIAAAAATEGFGPAAQRLADFGAGDIAIGEQNQAEFGKATSPAVAAAAFAAPVGGITAPLKTAFGWHVVRVEALGKAGLTLDQARPAIAAALATRATEAAVADMVARIEDGVDSGKSFADLAKENSLAIIAQAAVTKEGGSAAGTPPTALQQSLAAKAFRHEPGDGAAVEDLGQGQLAVIETMQILPSAPQPLADIRPAIAESAARARALKAARSKADAIVAATRKTGDFNAAVAAQALPPAQPINGRRIDVARQTNVPPVVQAFLATPAGQVSVLPSAQGWVLVHVTAIDRGDLAAVPGLVDAGRRELAGQGPEEFAAAFAVAAARDVGTTRNAAVIAAISKRLKGEDISQ